ncbi:MAG: phenylalanine--tRNA ligase subunit alpha, partial [Oscillospiraceae bacterium]
MKQALETIREQATQQIAAAPGQAELEALRVRYLGKKGELTAILKQMGGLSAEERPVIGALANEIREGLDDAVRARAAALAGAAQAQRLADETIDVSLPGRPMDLGGPHPIDKVLAELKTIFLGMGF